MWILGEFILHSSAAALPRVSFDWQMYKQMCKDKEGWAGPHREPACSVMLLHSILFNPLGHFFLSKKGTR